MSGNVLSNCDTESKRASKSSLDALTKEGTFIPNTASMSATMSSFRTTAPATVVLVCATYTPSRESLAMMLRVVLPNSLVVSYALGVCTSGESKEIFLAGLDGYTENSPSKYEMDELFQGYKLENKSKKISSLTPTNFKIKFIKNI